MVLNVEIVGKVKETLCASDKRHRLIVGGRGKGASWSIARILLLEGMSRPLFIPCVREVQKTIEHSVKKILADTINSLGLDFFYKVKKYEIIGINGTKFVFYGMQDHNADNIKSLEGADICWVAEAQSLSRRSINVLRPTIRRDGSVIWWDFNPRYATDPIYIDYIVNEDPNAEVLWLNWRDNPWFTRAMQMERDSDYARNREEAEHIWEGALRAEGTLFVCPSALVDQAIKNDIDLTIADRYAPDIVGADIAHQGGDKIVFYRRKGLKVIDTYKSRFQDMPTTVAHLKAFSDGCDAINIDNGDLGKGVADYIEKDGFRVNRVNFGGKPDDNEHYDDAVTEMYFTLRDLLEHADIPNDEELRAQLVQRQYDYVGGRRGYEVVKIESKGEFKEHAYIESNSPDEADALVLCFYKDRATGATARSPFRRTKRVTAGLKDERL